MECDPSIQGKEGRQMVEKGEGGRWGENGERKKGNGKGEEEVKRIREGRGLSNWGWEREKGLRDLVG